MSKNKNKKNGGATSSSNKKKGSNGAGAGGPATADDVNVEKIAAQRAKNKSSKKKTTPFWLTTPFIVCMVAILGSIVLTLEPVAVLVDDMFGTHTSEASLRRLEQEIKDQIARGTYPSESPTTTTTTTRSSSSSSSKISSPNEDENYIRTSEMNVAADELCNEHAHDPTSPYHCTAVPSPDDNGTKSPFTVQLKNDSKYRIDIHWEKDESDDAADGKKKSRTVIGNVEGNGASLTLTVFPHDKFVITRHGVREGLFYNSKPLWFIPTKINQHFVVPTDAAPSEDKCIDRYTTQCQQYARDGHCWNTPGWMIVHCCESCEKYAPTLGARQLVDVNVRCTKERMNITEPIWQPGDLDKLFVEWTTSPKYQQYQPVIHSSPSMESSEDGSSPPWVITFDNFFSAEEAQALIDGGHMAGFDRSTNQGATNTQGEMEMVESKTRTSSNAWCTGECQQLPLVQKVTNRIEDVTHIPSSHYEPFQVLDYGPNQFYKMHHDSTGRDLKPSGNRILTFFLYLSDVEEGGETQFNKLADGGLKVQPKLGRALVWPSVLDNEPDFWDDRMYHEAMPVIRGKKYAANHWIHLNNYETPNNWGCTGSFA